MKPPGLRKPVIADSPADMVTWVEEANRLGAGLMCHTRIWRVTAPR